MVEYASVDHDINNIGLGLLRACCTNCNGGMHVQSQDGSVGRAFLFDV